MGDKAQKDEVRNLKAKLKEVESNMIIAATHGKTLLEETVALKRQMASLQKQCDADVECLTQEVHTLRSTNDLLLNEATNLKENMEALAKTCKDLEQAKEAEAAKRQRISQEKVTLVTEVHALGDRAVWMEAEKGLLERQISEMKIAFGRQTSESQVDQDQKLSQLEEDRRQQLAAVSSLEQELARKDGALEASTSRCRDLEARVSDLEEELEGKMSEASCYASALACCRQEVSDLKAEVGTKPELEADANKRGNSLFGEIEDRRQMLEGQATRMQEKYRIVKAQHGTQQAQIRTLHLRMASLERNMSHKVDASYAERLEGDLAAAHREVDALRARSKFYDASTDFPKQQPEEALPQASSAYSFLSAMLAQEQQRVAQQEEEKKGLYSQYALARDEAQELRRRLYHKEKVYGAVGAENMRLRAEKAALLDKCRAGGCPDSPGQQMDSWSSVAVPAASALFSGEPSKRRLVAVGDKENAATSHPRSDPATAVQKKNDCKQQ